MDITRVQVKNRDDEDWGITNIEIDLVANNIY